jgi:hypothetical protein
MNAATGAAFVGAALHIVVNTRMDKKAARVAYRRTEGDAAWQQRTSYGPSPHAARDARFEDSRIATAAILAMSASSTTRKTVARSFPKK